MSFFSFFRLSRSLMGAIVGMLSCAPGFASHVVGADFTYTCQAGVYTVRLDLYQDCGSQQQQGVIQEDNPAYFIIFTGNGASAPGTRVAYNNNVQAVDSTIVPANFSNACITNYPATCLRRTTFTRDFVLPPNATGYRVVYQRCCRNASVVNLINPAEVGATYFVDIPPSSTAVCNNSAVFKNFPPQIICANNPLVYDNSATDFDGDSLSYELCSALSGGSINDAKPDPPSPPPYAQVQYSSPYTPGFPIAAFPTVQINATTGLLTGTPNLLGRYVVTVCCNEWRNGIRINTVKREFQFVVTPCSKTVVADIPQLSVEPNTYVVRCEDFTVGFVNDSRGANAGAGSPYFWDFGVPGIFSDTSLSEEPSFTYPDTGIYTVKLVVNRGSTCPDSIERLVKVYPSFRADFGVAGLLCPDAEVRFSDSTQSTYRPITALNWSFGDGGTATGDVVTHRYNVGGRYAATLIAQNIKGCLDTVTRELDIENFQPNAGADTIIVQGERIAFRARGGDFYTWTPGTYLDNPMFSNPNGYYPDLGRFGYNVSIRSNAGCVRDDSIYVRVVGQASLFVPSAFSPNGDGRNDLLRPIAIGFPRINYFRVFNRWGQQVFSSSAFGDGVNGEGWDGRVGGVPQDTGVYFWILSSVNRFGEEEMIKGDATLVR